MPDIKPQIKLKGSREVIAKLKIRTKKLKNMKPVYKRAAIVLQQWVLRNFQSEGKIQDSPFQWPLPLKSRDGMALQDTGRLRGSFRVLASQKRGAVKSGVFYAVFHEKGNKDNRPPQRKIFPTDERALKLVNPVFEKFAKDVAAGKE